MGNKLQNIASKKPTRTLHTSNRNVPGDQLFQFNELYLDEFDALHITIQTSTGLKKYPAHEHALNVVKHLGVHEGLIYLAGTPALLSEDSDQPLPFKQRRYFYYLSGVDFPDCALTYDIASSCLTLYIPAPNPAEVIWLGPTPSVAECLEKYDVDHVSYTVDLPTHLAQWRLHNLSQKIYLLHPNHAPPNPTRNPSNPSPDTTSLLPAMDSARVLKSPFEISLIRRANTISSAAHRHVLANLHSVTNETHIEALFTQSCLAQRAKKQAYGIIAASGPNASTLHYVANDEDVAGRELVCLDAGCEWDCYASDVTRTFPLSGSFGTEAAAVYAIVAEMQTRCIEAIRPGKVFAELHRLAMEIGVRGLMGLGILRNGTLEEILAAGTGRAFFPHGLGHHIGLECHDVSGANPLLARSIPTMHDLSSLRPSLSPSSSSLPYDRDRALEPNMVITIEPGLYFSRYALTEVYAKDPAHARYIDFAEAERYYKVGGVRIEDDILVTRDGWENLTSAPKGEEMCRVVREGLGR